MKHSFTGGVLTALILISSTSAIAGQRYYHNDHRQNEYHQQGKGHVEVTKEVSRDGVIIHKTITKPNGETYTIDKEVGKGRQGYVDIEKKRNGRVIHREHHQR